MTGEGSTAAVRAQREHYRKFLGVADEQTPTVPTTTIEFMDADHDARGRLSEQDPEAYAALSAAASELSKLDPTGRIARDARALELATMRVTPQAPAEPAPAEPEEDPGINAEAFDRMNTLQRSELAGTYPQAYRRLADADLRARATDLRVR